jgi:DNA-binding CsgD family transcriptional regulator
MMQATPLFDLNQSTLILLESLNEGVMILNESQDVILANTTGKYICKLLQPDTQALHPRLKKLCDMLIDSRTYEDDVIVLHDTIPTPKTTFEVRGQWVTFGDRPYLLLNLQDQKAMRRGQAMAEAMLWDLTSRERQVWLLRRLGESRKAIATTLYVAEDTVKKHLKNINAKKLAVESSLEASDFLQAS